MEYTECRCKIPQRYRTESIWHHCHRENKNVFQQPNQKKGCQTAEIPNLRKAFWATEVIQVTLWVFFLKSPVRKPTSINTLSDISQVALILAKDSTLAFKFQIQSTAFLPQPVSQNHKAVIVQIRCIKTYIFVEHSPQTVVNTSLVCTTKKENLFLYSYCPNSHQRRSTG